uniref:Cyclic nucleotide-binding domain-containing protein n=1 Tax=Guillardia theta TaxID=55529 RepID=A0A7S4H8T1_GUITH|mmetsp:Transcript_10643/g.35655  ORF Transcript_10643/g.35655 Transcript_10643/m.35655 type:complete len:3029 (+) Transcript_10643:96-9182(+)
MSEEPETMKVAESQAVEEDKGGGELPGMIPPTEDNTTADDTAVHEDRANANIDGDEDKALSGHETPPEAATDRSDNGTGTGAHTPDTQPSKSVEHSMGTENDDEQKKSGEQSLQDGSHVAGEVNVTESLAPVGSASTSPPEGSEVQTAASTDTPSDETSKTHEASEGSKASDQVERLNTNNGEIASEIKAEALPPGANGTEKQQNITNQGEEIKQTVPNGHDGVNSNGDQGNGTDLQHTNGNLTHREGGNGYSSKEAIDKVNGGKQSGKASRLVKLIQTSSADSMGDLLDEDDGSMKLKRRSSLFAGLMSRGAGIRRRSSNFSIDSMSSVATKLSTIQTIAWLKVKAKKATRVKRKSCLKHESVLQSESNSNIAKIQRVRFSLPKKKTVTSKSIFFDPNHIWMGRWHMFFVLPLAYEIWAGGFRLAFADPDSNTWIFDLDLTCDLLFIVDAAIYLNTMIMVGDESRLQGRNEHAMYIKDRTIIAKKYFLHVFPYQLLPGIVFLSISKPSTHIGVWWVIMFLRLLPRALRLYRYFRSMEINLEVSVNQLQLVKFSLVIAMASHWIGSLYFWAARIHQVEETWLYELDTIFPLYSMNSSTIAQNYLLCLYKGFDGLSSIGYIPIVPNNSFEMVLSVLVMYNSILISAYILGSLFHYLLVSQKDPLTEAHKKRMTDVIAFAEARRLAPAVRKKLIQHFEFQYKKSVQRKASASLKLPRSLEVKVANSRFRPTVEKCCKPGGIFYHCNAQFLNNLVTHLRPVFLMPGDQFIRASEMVLELSFVIDGHAEVVDEDEVKRIIRSDIDDPSVIGDVSFFLGVQQQYSVRAPLDTDIELLVLSKESGEELFRNYPEQQELVSNNILASFNLDKFGNDKSDEKSAEDGEEDPEYLFMRNLIRDTVKRRQEESFLALSYAATAGDLEEVRRMLRKGVSVNSTNYDGKTIMHMAASEGNYRVVELLLEEGAEKNQKDRWGNTPLQDAINNTQGPVIQLLAQWNCELRTLDPSGKLCAAAAAGDLETLKFFLEHGVSPNVVDFDHRSPLHLAAAEGHNKVAEYLLSKGADLNACDRWGKSPLQDAVSAGHVQVAEQIYTRGGILSGGTGTIDMCRAAAEGDVRHLSLLHRCGVDPDVGNYDKRCPLHFAGANGRLLAINYLLGVSANPNLKDRWGNTPFDDCMFGNTSRHVMCAKLLQAAGGKSGKAKELMNSDNYKQFWEDLEELQMESVRKVIKHLIKQGLDRTKPHRPSIEAFWIARESCDALVDMSRDMMGLFNHAADLLSGKREVQAQVFDKVKDCILTCATFSDRINDFKLGTIKQEVTAVIEMKQEGALPTARAFFEKLENDIDINEYIQTVVDHELLALYEELDTITSTIEKRGRDTLSGKIFLAKEFNRCLMNLNRVEEMWFALVDAFQAALGPADGNSLASYLWADFDQFSKVLEALQIDLNTSRRRELFFSSIDADQDTNQSDRFISPTSLLCQSQMFRDIMCQEADEDSLKLSSLFKSNVLRVLSFSHLQYIAWRSKRVILKEGQKLTFKEPCMFLVNKGRLRVMLHNDASDICLKLEYGSDTLFGEVWLLTGFAPILMVRAVQRTELIQVHKSDIAAILQVKTQLVIAFAHALTKDSEFDQYEKEILTETIAKEEFDHVSLVASKDVHQSETELRVRAYMETIHKHFEVGMADNTKRLSLAFAIWRGLAKMSSKRIHNFTSETNPKKAIELGIKTIEKSWEIFSAGMSVVHFNEVSPIQEFLGEVGQSFFASAFDPQLCPKLMDKSDWYSRWVLYINDINSTVGKAGSWKNMSGGSFRIREDVPLLDQAQDDDQGSEFSHDEFSSPSYSEQLRSFIKHLFYSSIKGLLLSEEIVSAYESTFHAVVGDTSKPLLRSKVKEFLALLLLDYSGEINDMHVEEFMQVFAPEGKKAHAVSFFEIEKKIREVNASYQSELMMGNSTLVLNPNSFALRFWRTGQHLGAFFYFFHVPARIAFLPYQSMLDTSLFASSFLVDLLVILNLFVGFNVAYMNKQSRWVTDRLRIARHYLSRGFWIDALAALPLDWFGYMSGASIALCSWSRVPKMLYLLSAQMEHKSCLLDPLLNKSHVRLAINICMILHLTSCFWFLMGRRGLGEPLSEATWYEPSLEAYEQRRHLLTSYVGYGMPGSEYSGTWNKYLLSLYWVSSTVSSTGVIGDMWPKNYGEIAYTIFLLCLNLTLFNYIIGEISAGVLKGDEKLVKVREEIGAVESYLQSFNIPSDLKLEIRRYFQGSSVGSTFYQASDIFDSVSHSLRLEMSSTMTRECLDNVALFRSCSPQLKANIQGLLREMHFASDEFLYQSNMVAHEMFFVIAGAVDQLVQDNDGFSVLDKNIGPGESVGDLSFFFGMRHIHAARASSGQGAVCLRLVRSQLMPILEAYPDDEELVAQNALRQFQLTKHARSAAGTSRHGKSIASFAAPSAFSALEDEAKSADEADEKSLTTEYRQSVQEDNNYDAIILSNIEQKVAFLNQRRKTEHVAAFCGASSRGELEKMLRFLRIGLNVDETDSNGRTALHVAACEGKLDAVKLLITNSASVSLRDKYGNTPLNDAVRHGQDHVAAILRSQNQALNFPGKEAGVLLCSHAFHGKLADIERLISNGINVNESNYDLRTALHLAACEGHEDVVKYLLSKSADVNCRDRLGRTPLCDALVHCHTNIQDMLREAGGQLLGMDIAVELCTAAAKGDVSQLRALIRNSANPDAADADRRTALHLAASNGETTVLDYLLRHLKRPININPVDRLGGTPLEDAYRHDQKVAVAMLEAAFGLRKDNPQLIEMQDVQRREVDALQKAERMPTVQEQLNNSEESKADVWVRGRCGKLIPNQISMISAASEQVEQDLKEVIESISAVKDTVLNLLAEGRLSAAAEAGNIDFSQSLVFKELHAGSMMEELRGRAEHLLQSLWSWNEVVGQIMVVISEELPAIKIVRLGSHSFREEAEKMLTLFRRLSAAGKFMDQTIRQTLQVVHVELRNEEEQHQQKSFRRTAVESRLMNNIEFPTKHLLQNAFTMKG